MFTNYNITIKLYVIIELIFINFLIKMFTKFNVLVRLTVFLKAEIGYILQNFHSEIITNFSVI